MSELGTILSIRKTTTVRYCRKFCGIISYEEYTGSDGRIIMKKLKVFSRPDDRGKSSREKEGGEAGIAV